MTNFKATMRPGFGYTVGVSLDNDKVTIGMYGFPDEKPIAVTSFTAPEIDMLILMLRSARAAMGVADIGA